MARFGVVGDTHGNSRWLRHVLNEMGKRKIATVFVVGDFGLWGGLAGHQFLDAVQRSAEDNNLSVFAIPGNHENYDLFEHYQEMYPTHKGFTYLRTRVLMSPKANSFKMFGKKFVVAGGAHSIDKDWRLAKERGGTYRGPDSHWSEHMGRGTGAGTLWWPQETLTDEEEAQIIGYGKCDILLSHDASDHTPWSQRLKPDLDSQIHRQRIDRIIKAVKPDIHFHGHFHEKYSWVNTRSHGNYDEGIGTYTYGLECDGMDDSWGIFDTDTNLFAFQGEGMNFRSLEE